MCLSSCFTETAPSAPMQSVVMYMCSATANTGVNSLLRRTECLMVRWKAEAHAKSGRRAAAPRRRLWCDWWDNFGLNSPDLGLGGVCSHPLGTVSVPQSFRLQGREAGSTGCKYNCGQTRGNFTQASKSAAPHAINPGRWNTWARR